MVGAITAYIAHRLIEREKALAADYASGGAGAAVAARAAARAQALGGGEPAQRAFSIRAWRIFLFFVEFVGSATFFGLLHLLGVWVVPQFQIAPRQKENAMAFTRRSFLAGFISCPLCAALARAEDAQWDYEDVHSWGAHSTNEACAFGGEQSPVDLTGAINAKIRAPTLSWKPQAFTVVNNGHTIQANAAPEASPRRRMANSSSSNFIFTRRANMRSTASASRWRRISSTPRKAATFAGARRADAGQAAQIRFSPRSWRRRRERRAMRR